MQSCIAMHAVSTAALLQRCKSSPCLDPHIAATERPKQKHGLTCCLLTGWHLLHSYWCTRAMKDLPAAAVRSASKQHRQRCTVHHAAVSGKALAWNQTIPQGWAAMQWAAVHCESFVCIPQMTSQGKTTQAAPTPKHSGKSPGLCRPS